MPCAEAAGRRSENPGDGQRSVTGLAPAQSADDRGPVCMLTGGPCVFVGRPNDVTHQGLEITQELWDKSQKALADTLDEMKVKDPDKSELLAVIDALKVDIIQKPKAPTKPGGQ